MGMREELIHLLVMARYEATKKCHAIGSCLNCPGGGGKGCWAVFEAEYLIGKGVTLQEYKKESNDG